MSFREKLLRYFVEHDRGWTLSLFILVCVIYLPFIGNAFFFDDISFFYGTNKFGNAVEYFRVAPPGLELRWLPYASLARIWAWAGDVPHLYHLGNTLLHAANVILLFYLLRYLLAAVLPEHHGVSRARGAWFGSLIYACNPVAVYAVGYVVQCSILMANFFGLVMQLAFLRGLVTGQSRWLVLAVSAYLLAGYSREHSLMLPAILMAMTVLLREKNQLGMRALWMGWMAFIIVGVLIVLSSKGVIGKSYEIMSSEILTQQEIAVSTHMLHLYSVMTQAGLFFKYLLLWLVPNPAWMSIDMREPFLLTFTHWKVWLGVSGFIAYGAMGIWLLYRSRWRGLLGLALLYPWLHYIVEFSTVRIQETFVLYRSYLWMPGIALFVALLLIKLQGRRVIVVAGCIIFLLIPLSWNRLWVFADNYRLWNDAAQQLNSEQVTGADRIFYNRAHAAMAAHDWEGAIEDLHRVIALSPQLVPAHNALGNAYFNAGRYHDAIAHFDAAILLGDNDAQPYFGKGLSLKRLHKDRQALKQMKKSCELKNMMACMIVESEQGKAGKAARR